MSQLPFPYPLMLLLVLVHLCVYTELCITKSKPYIVGVEIGLEFLFFADFDSKISDFGTIFFILNSENSDSGFFLDRNWNIYEILIFDPIFYENYT